MPWPEWPAHFENPSSTYIMHTSYEIVLYNRGAIKFVEMIGGCNPSRLPIRFSHHQLHPDQDWIANRVSSQKSLASFLRC